MTGGKALCRYDHGCHAAFHVRRAASVQHAVFHGGNERVRLPLLARACRHHVGMSGKTQYRPLGAVPRPEILHRSELQTFVAKACLLQAPADDIHAAVVFGADRRTADEFGRKLQCRRRGKRICGHEDDGSEAAGE